MNEQQSKRLKITAAAIIAAVVIIDQIIKVLVKTNMALGETIDVTGWCQIAFVENNGMAFGMSFLPKIVLTLFRIVVVIWIMRYMWRLLRRETPTTGYIVCLSFIVAGAAGNIIDCMFYGLVFEPSTPDHIAGFVSFGDGYGTFLNGLVVDMFHFPLFELDWPDWLPLIGGKHFEFFSAVFNFADAAITCGIAALLLFYRDRISGSKDKE